MFHTTDWSRWEIWTSALMGPSDSRWHLALGFAWSSGPPAATRRSDLPFGSWVPIWLVLCISYVHMFPSTSCLRWGWGPVLGIDDIDSILRSVFWSRRSLGFHRQKWNYFLVLFLLSFFLSIPDFLNNSHISFCPNSAAHWISWCHQLLSVREQSCSFTCFGLDLQRRKLGH